MAYDETKGSVVVEVFRKDLVESVHHGHIAIVNRKNNLIKSFGDTELKTFIRSAAKPIQAIPVVEKGAAKAFKMTDKEIALMTASHNGELEHEETGRELIKKLELDLSYLNCGIHPPQYEPRAIELYEKGERPGPLHCNCSGKHLGMLALAKHLGYPMEGYIEKEHPIQQLMLQTIKKYSLLQEKDIQTGTDGCGVPVFAMPLRNMALMYANLMVKIKSEEAPKRVVESMLKHPWMVAGTDRLCTDLMASTEGRIVAKVGTEGIYCIGLLEEELGIAIKIADGNPRALGPVVVETLAQLGLLRKEERTKLQKWHLVELKNYQGEVVGKICPSFTLH